VFWFTLLFKGWDYVRNRTTGDERTDEGSDTVPRLAELETSGGRFRSADDDSVRVGGSFESSETTSDDESAGAETTKDSATVGVAIGRLGDRPEQNSTERVESETHQDSELVTAALENLSSDGREEEVTATKVHDLQASGLELCDTEDGLEVLVEDIEKTVGETPEEEEGDDEGEGEDEGATSQVAACELGSRCGDSTACHCDGIWMLIREEEKMFLSIR